MNYDSFYFKKLINKPINNLINIIIDCVHKLSPIKNDLFRRNTKYTIKDYAIGIIDVMKNHTSWNSYNGLIKGDTLRKKHSEWVKLGIYDDVYKTSLKKYLKTTKPTEEFKYQSIDSTFIQELQKFLVPEKFFRSLRDFWKFNFQKSEDINGSKYASYSGIYKHRKGESSKGIKITSIVITEGIPISVGIDPGNRYDSPILPKAINNLVINCNTKKYAKHNRFKQYFLADSGYDSKNNQKILKKKGYIPLIVQNKKNIKNESLIREFNIKQAKIYKKRIKIENYHSWIKKFKKIKCLYEHNISNYYGLLMVAISVIINRRIINNKT